MMIFDTNVITELMRPEPSAKVVEWIDYQNSQQFYVTTITIAEIIYGLAALPAGNRRKSLESAFNATLETCFKHRILTFDEAASRYYGQLMGHRKQMGKPLSILDGQIAAITLSNKAILVSRNLRDFSDCDLELINPF